MHKIMNRVLAIVLLLMSVLAFPIVGNAQELVCNPETEAAVYAVTDSEVFTAAENGQPAGSLVEGEMVCSITLVGDMAQVRLADNRTVWVATVNLTDVAPAQEQAEVTTFALPSDLRELANGIGALGYEEPDQRSDDGNSACYERTDMNEPCSTLEQQPVAGVFTLGDTLQPGLRLINGDVIELRLGDVNGVPIVQRIPTEIGGTNGDMYVLYSNEGVAETNVYMDAPHGSFRGDFFLPFPQREWGMDDVITVTGNQMRLLLINSLPAIQAWLETDEPYPTVINPANCSTVESLDQGEVTYCDAYNLYVLEWDGTSWIEHFRGVVGVFRDDANNALELAYLPVDDALIAEYSD